MWVLQYCIFYFCERKCFSDDDTLLGSQGNPSRTGVSYPQKVFSSKSAARKRLGWGVFLGLHGH